MDEIVDVIQDGINATYKAWYAKTKEELVKLTEVTYPTMLRQLEKRLEERGGEWMVGNTFTWADLHLFFFCTEDFLEPGVLAAYPKIANLAGRVGAMPNIKTWMESRPADGKMHPGYKIYFQNAYKCIKDMEWRSQYFDQKEHLPYSEIKLKSIKWSKSWWKWHP